jgi:hypothetical protein
MFHWIPTTLKKHEQNEVKLRLGKNEMNALSGGSSQNFFELLDGETGNVINTYSHNSLEDAVSSWVRELRKSNAKTPVEVGDLKLSINAELGCTCDTPECVTPKQCRSAADMRTHEFTDAYNSFMSAGLKPMTLHVRTTSSGKTRRLHINFTPNTSPSLEDVRHGVVARMHVSSRPHPRSQKEGGS